jgi:Dimerisation domain
MIPQDLYQKSAENGMMSRCSVRRDEQRHHFLRQGAIMEDASAKAIDLIFGRWRSQILYAGVKLGVFDALASGPNSAVSVAEAVAGRRRVAITCSNREHR